MNVGLALNLFSKSFSSGLRYLQEQEGRCIVYETTTRFVDSINKCVDLDVIWTSGVGFTYQLATAVFISSKVMTGIPVGVKVAWKPLQTVMIMSTRTVLNLRDELLYGKLEFLLTSRLTQD